MYTHFNDIEKSVHLPDDRRFVFRLNPKALIVLVAFISSFLAAAWLQYLIFGLPDDPSASLAVSPADPKGFPWWVILCHWINFFFVVLLIRSGVSILMDQPRLYWNNASRPGSEWLKFTPLTVPEDKVWTAKDYARYISPIFGLPGYRHTVGIARGWHFIHVPFFIINGVIFVIIQRRSLAAYHS